jgi:hypothetical protein
MDSKYLANDLIENEPNLFKKSREEMFGCMRGKFKISEDFDEEMDEYGRFASEPDFGKPVKEIWD